MAKTDIKVKDLVEMIDRGELKLPEMQRKFVWKSTRVRDLFDSLYRGYPSGSILVWETDKEQPTRNLSVAQKENPFSGHKLLLDGQQRLTSLTSVIKGEPIQVRNRRRPIEILFNLDHPESISEFTEVDSDEDSLLYSEDEIEVSDEEDDEDITLQERLKQMTFVVKSKSLAQQLNWISVTEVFKGDSEKEILKKAGVKSFEDPRYEKYSERLKKLKDIRNYPYSMHVLSNDLSYEEVAEIFVRVNSLGAKLRGSDLAMAQITARWPKSLGLLEEYQEICEKYHMTLDLGLLVRAMVVFATDQSRFRTVSSTKIESLKKGWEKAKEGIDFSINFLRKNADIEDETLLSSPLFFIIIAYYIYTKKGKLSSKDERSLLYWFYIANAKGHYSKGSSESIFDADLNIIKKGGGPDELLENLEQQFGRLDFNVNDFIGKGARSALFSLVFLALKSRKAKDWQSGLELSLTHQGRYYYIQYHHIFPKSLLKAKYEKSEINEIANMAFITGKINRKISNKEPKLYFKELEKSVVEKQCVPMSEELLSIDNYREFLKQRRILLVNLVNDFVENVKK